jgi:hypothetical protein
MMVDAEFMQGWEDPATVTHRLSRALKSRGIFSSVVSSTITPLSHSGLSGDVSSLILAFDDETSMKLVLKRTRSSDDSKKYSKKLGLYREGIFYSQIGPWIQAKLDQVPNAQKHNFIPQSLFSESDDETGQKAIVLQYYSNAVEAGVHFPHSVHNVVRKMETQQTETDESESSTRETAVLRKSITLEAVRIAALLHGSFYQDDSLLTDASFTKNLRMADWIQGKGKESFLESQREIVERWSDAKARWLSGEFFDGKVQLGKEFVEVMDASCALALDFDSFVSKWNNDCSNRDDDRTAWSLVHGDYHPGNLLYLHDENINKDAAGTPKLILVDWEVVGVGSGPQDIGQFLISHTETQEAFDLLDEATTVYRQTLQSTLDAISNNNSKKLVPSTEAIKKEIVFGGIERWVWLFAYMAGWEQSMPWLYMQFFHDQMQKFIVINGIKASSVGMPRP